MRRNLLLLLALPIVGYLAVKLYIQIQVDGAVETLINRAEPVAAITYGRVTSGIDGRVGLSGVVIRPAGTKDQIRIDEVSIKVPDLLYLLMLEDRMRSLEPPQSLSLKVHDVAVSTRGEMVRAWEAAMFEHDPLAREQALDNCVTRVNLPTQLHLLDYDEIRGSFEIGYYYDAQRANLMLHGAAGHIGGVSFTGELALVLHSFDIDTITRTLRNPEIAGAVMEITDAGYFQRVYAYCEQDGQLDRQGVAALLAEHLLAQFDGLPMAPDEPLMAAYADFVSAGSRITITAEPREPRKLEYLSLYDPLDVPAVLNVNARVY